MKEEKVLLLSCCAPCSCAVIEKVAKNGQDVSVIFYNPNISPFDEYVKRRDENKKVCDKYQIPFIELEYDNDVWLAATAGLENEPERGKRCDICFRMRIKKTMEYASENGFDAVGSVLGVSRHKDLDQVNRAAGRAFLETEVPYVHFEGRQSGMQERREELIKELGLYNQKYCGCKYSMKKEEKCAGF